MPTATETATRAAPLIRNDANFDWTVPSKGDDLSRAGIPLPPQLLIQIVSYLDDPTDLARVCRTCRKLYYISLPVLYSNVRLRSYSEIRISPETGRPIGWGGATPFFMGLNALVTRPTVAYIKRLELLGNWKDRNDDESSRMGLVPDESMMLSLLVRSAIDRIPRLEEFVWALDTKMLPAVWQGLCAKQTLHTISIRMPSSRQPMPILDVPPIPSLRSLTIRDIDPLCYPDSIGTLLYGSKRLEHLKLHWSPRMRKAREPSTNVQAYFGKCLAKNYSMPLKSLAIQNLYSVSGAGSFGEIVNPQTIESYTLLSSMPGENDTADMAFVGYSWQWAPPSPLRMPNLKTLRGDKISRRHVTVLAGFSGLERYYLASGRKLEDRPMARRRGEPSGRSPSATNGLNADGSDPSTPSGSSADTPISPFAGSAESLGGASTTTAMGAAGDQGVLLLGSAYLDAACRAHGPTLKHLLLMPHWRLGADDLVRLCKSAPNLEQLGVGIGSDFALDGGGSGGGKSILKLVQPFARKLKALRLLDSPRDWDVGEEAIRVGDEAMEQVIARESWGREFDGLRWLGFGELVFEVLKGDGRQVRGEGGRVEWRRRVRRRSLRAVRDVEVWKMDRLTLDV